MGTDEASCPHLCSRLLVLALAGPAHAGISVGVADDRPLGQPDGGAAFFAVMSDVGLRDVRLSVLWDATQPMTIAHQVQLESVLPVATLRGMNVTFSVAPLKARSIAVPGAQTQFVAFVDHVARTFPTVKNIIVGNEPEPATVLAASVRRPRPPCLGRRVPGAAGAKL